MSHVPVAARSAPLLATLVLFAGAPNAAAQCDRQVLSSPFGAGDKFGEEVAVDGDVLLVAATNANAVAFYHEAAGTFALAHTEVGLAGEGFGLSLAVDGNRAAVGVPYRDVAGMADAGAVELFERIGGAWQPVGTLTAAAPAAGASFGFDVSLGGGRLAVGEPYATSAKGRAHIYVYAAGSVPVLAQSFLAPTSGITPSDRFGTSLAIDDFALIIGAPGGTQGGHVHHYRKNLSGNYAYAGGWVAGIPNFEMGRHVAIAEPFASFSFHGEGDHVMWDGMSYVLLGESNLITSNSVTLAVGGGRFYTGGDKGVFGPGRVVVREFGAPLDSWWFRPLASTAGFSGAVATDGTTLAVGAVSASGNGQVLLYDATKRAYQVEVLGNGPSAHHMFTYGSLCDGSSVRIPVSSAPNDTVLFVVGANTVGVPLYGGTLFPSPDVIAPINVGPSGAIDIMAPLPAVVPAGASVTIQYWFPDATAIGGWRGSDGNRLTFAY